MVNLVNWRIFILSASSLLLSFGLFGQITGTIVDSEDNEPLIGAAILNTTTGIGAVSDIDGNFRIAAQEGDVLNFS